MKRSKLIQLFGAAVSTILLWSFFSVYKTSKPLDNDCDLNPYHHVVDQFEWIAEYSFKTVS